MLLLLTASAAAAAAAAAGLYTFESKDEIYQID
jgi:hypothetical protein